jgi:hypothetical protein
VLIAYATALVSAAFAVAVALRYARSRRAALLAWAVGLSMFALAAFAGGLAQTGDPTEAEYRLFYLFGAILNVAWLATGTVLLIAPRFGRYAVIAAAALSVVSVYAVSVTPVDLRVALATGKGFPDGSLPRALALIGSGIGSLVLFGGALWSAWVFLRKGHNGRRALSNAVIAVGVLIVAYGGTATFTGASDILESANLVGVSVMFLGFLLA